MSAMDVDASIGTQPQLSDDDYPEEIQELLETISEMPLEGLQQMANMMAEDVTAKDIRLAVLAKLKSCSTLEVDDLRSACASAVHCLAASHVTQHKRKQARVWKIRIITCAVFAMALALRMYQQGNLDVVIQWVRTWVPVPGHGAVSVVASPDGYGGSVAEATAHVETSGPMRAGEL